MWDLIGGHRNQRHTHTHAHAHGLWHTYGATAPSREPMEQRDSVLSCSVCTSDVHRPPGIKSPLLPFLRTPTQGKISQRVGVGARGRCVRHKQMITHSCGHTCSHPGHSPPRDGGGGGAGSSSLRLPPAYSNLPAQILPTPSFSSVSSLFLTT